mmetsp:Transcript_41732/g.54960  ORF Transcript_41732/g.54960 Transcript_41732/m.54960 type:complete len:186 (+) Transcript_41732:1065-1622(+)
MVSIIVIFSLLSWVRNLAKLSFTFMLGITLVLITTIYVTCFAIERISEQGGMAQNVAFLEPSGYLGTLGFTIYSYEGIGIVMPIMATTEKPERFKAMLTYALITLTSIYICFALICYFAWGPEGMDQAIVTQMLPADSVTVVIIKMLYSMNILCSYAIVIFPANQTIEGWFFGCFSKNSKKLYWV